eukprot:27387-Chlamydomonas_euryale.AAC.9
MSDRPHCHAISRHRAAMRPLTSGLLLHVAARRGVAVAAAAAEKEKWVPVQRTLPVEDRLSIGIVGFGLFGQFLARRMVLAGHRVLATSRADYSKEAADMGVEYFM